MINEDYFKNYKLLISNSIGYFDIMRGVTHGGLNKFEEEIIQYNEYISPRRFEAQLKSYSALIEDDIRDILEYKAYNIYCDNSILKELSDLGALFLIEDGFVKHKNFKLIKNDNAKNIHITQSFFSDFIEVAYKSIKHLNSFHDIEEKLKALLIGDEYTRLKNLAIIDEVLKELNIVNDMRECILGERQAFLLWALIYVLEENMLINYKSQETCMEIFWEYIKANRPAPKKPHIRSKGNEIILEKTRKYFKTKKNNDN